MSVKSPRLQGLSECERAFLRKRRNKEAGGGFCATKTEQSELCSDVVAELGFEPRQSESESLVLPLHNSASNF